MKKERVVAPLRTSEDKELESRLRPKTLDEFVGQEHIKEQLRIFIQAARERGDPLDHILFFGPPGLGKTTLAYIISHEMGVNLVATSGPVLDKPVDLSALLTRLEERNVLFIDEVHRLTPQVEEILYPAMEDFKLDIILGKGPSAKSIKLSLPPFTLVGASTRIGLLTSPLRARFGITFRIGYYPVEEVERIVIRSAQILNISLDKEGAIEIAKRSRGTPRIANRLLRRVRDFAQVKAKGRINGEVAREAMEWMGVDETGLDEMDRTLLSVIVKEFGGGPVGLKTIALAVGEEESTIEEVYEPYLVQQGFIKRTPQGRVATAKAFDYLGISHKNQPQLWREL